MVSGGHRVVWSFQKSLRVSGGLRGSQVVAGYLGGLGGSYWGDQMVMVMLVVMVVLIIVVII